MRSANIVQVGDRTRLVLNLTRVGPYEARVQGRDLIIALSPAVIVGIGSTIFTEFTSAISCEPTIDDALSIMLASLALL